jgi:KaiC/GvpD/RAD55 family RecA-like ATPase
MERVKTGIPGLDELIEGGIPEKDLVLLSGVCGAGKTIFGLQFLLSGKDPGIYVSFEEELSKIRNTADIFKWDIEKLEKEGRLRLLKYDPFKIEDIFEVIESNIRIIKAKRIVIDSISSLGIYVKDAADLRRMILQISSMLRKNSCTCILISEILAGKESLSRFNVEEFVSDGVILLHNKLIADEYRRGISIWKMKTTNHSKKIHPYKITDHGITVYPKDIFTMK